MIPQEGSGVSNDAQPCQYPPKWEGTAFALQPQAIKALTINIRY